MDLSTLHTIGEEALEGLLRHMGLDPAAADGSLALYLVSASRTGGTDDEALALDFLGFEGETPERIEELGLLAARLVAEKGITSPVTIRITGNVENPPLAMPA